ncbi:hypothetical protein AN958_01560 [Leucoagaricus sp. SymC.cos]|nr:hypothetical protein AN958_01560 [Leucoagaricus sp. SymC.cos]
MKPTIDPDCKQTSQSKQKWLKKKDFNDLETLLCKQFGFIPHTFQVKAISMQLLGEDVLLHTGTGSGKIAIAAGPHMHKKMERCVSFVCSPLIALEEEQVHYISIHLPIVPCCNVCTSKLLKHTCPALSTITKCMTTLKCSQIAPSVVEELKRWQTLFFEINYPDAMFGDSGLFPDSLIDLLSLVGPIKTYEQLIKILSPY